LQTQTLESSARLLNAVAIVTGGASGIGHGIATEFALEGAAVAILDQNREAAEKVVKEITGRGGKAVAVTADVTDEGQVEKAVKSVADQLGDASVLVNCAGLNQFASVEELPDGLWEKIRAINLDGPWHVSKAVMPAMIRSRGGRIVNISSAAGVRAIPKAVPYSAAKHGLVGLTRALALDLAPFGINVNCICPATIETPLVRQAVNNVFLEKMLETIPLGRFGTPRDIARAVVFLCSSDADWITGVVLPVDGGLTCGIRAHHFE
jgi:meso-butanediol dehydrogenase / (S,S)-butanediol dehydrogenase / diacetyl reductase